MDVLVCMKGSYFVDTLVCMKGATLWMHRYVRSEIRRVHVLWYDRANLEHGNHFAYSRCSKHWLLVEFLL